MNAAIDPSYGGREGAGRPGSWSAQRRGSGREVIAALCPGSAWHVGRWFHPGSPGFRRGLLVDQHAATAGHVTADKKPRTEVRGHRAVGPFRIGMARWAVVSPGVPRLPPGASWRTVHQQTAFAKRLAEDGHPPVGATRCRVFRVFNPVGRAIAGCGNRAATVGELRTAPPRCR